VHWATENGLGGIGLDPDEYDDATCDSCNAPIVGLRFKCLDSLCPRFDLCEKCYEAGFENEVHKSSHRMIPLRPGDAALLHETHDPFGGPGPPLPAMLSSPVIDNSIIVGLRVFTKDCKDPPVTVRGQLRHGSLITWTRPNREE